MEDLLLTCPHCKTVCTVDDAGDLVAVEQEQLPEGTNRGLGGLKVVEASPDWRRHSELSNLQLEPKSDVEAGLPVLGREKLPVPIPADPSLDAANSNDLKDRGLNQ